MKKKQREKVVKKKVEIQAPIQAPPPRGLVQYKADDGEQIKLSFDIVRKHLVSGNAEFVSETELIFYIGQCRARRLNPFKKDCYLIKYDAKDNAAIVIAIDYLRARARAYPDCLGWTGGIIVERDGAEIRKEGAFLAGKEKLLGGWFKARPKGWNVDRTWEVQLEKYIRRKRDGNLTRFWQAVNQPEMIAKVAESQGLRRVWPDPQGTLYVREEILPGGSVEIEASIVDQLPMPTAKIEPEKKPPEPQNAASSPVPTKKIESSNQESKPKTNGAAVQEIRDSIAAIVTLDDLREMAASIDKKLGAIKEKDSMLSLIREWNDKKQRIVKAQK